jgi:hypothetical protein
MAISPPATGPIHDWLVQEPNLLVKSWRGISWCWHVGLRKSSLGTITIGATLAALWRVLLLVLTVTIPIWDKYLEALAGEKPKTIPEWWHGLSRPVLYAVLAVVVLHLVKVVDERMAKGHKERNARVSAMNTLTTHRATVGGEIAHDIEVAQLSRVYPNPTEHSQAVMDRCNQLCRCMLQEVRLFLDELDNRYLEVSLLVYTDASGAKLRVVSRGDGSGRPIHQPGNSVPSGGTLAHASVFRPTTSVVQDLKTDKVFSRTSLTNPGQAPPYRSIVALPLRNPRADGNYDVYGVVTVDSASPYQFLGLGPALIKILAPYTELLKPYAAAYGSVIEVVPAPVV